MLKTIIKRDGRTAEFHPQKIADAVEKSFQACAAMQDRATAEQIAATVVEKLESGAIEGTPTVEGVQDLVRRPSSSPASCRPPRPTSYIAPSAAACAT